MGTISRRCSVLKWALRTGIDAVIWTDTPANFRQRCGKPFSVPAALRHIRALNAATKAKVAEYV